MKTNPMYSLILAFAMLACELQPAEKEKDPNENGDIELSTAGKKVVSAANDFGIDIFQLLLEDEPVDKNIFISPVSISLALAMTYNGAKNATEDSMAYALRMNNLTPEEINSTYKDLIEGLTSADEKVLMDIANSIWYRQGFMVEQDFLNINSHYYNSEVQGLDFEAPESVDIINNWVAENTNNKIPTILDQISPDHVMFLINAIYFKAIWTLEFDPQETRDDHFRLANGNLSEISMMQYQDTINYFENDDFQAVELDYGAGNFSMVILLPKGNLTTEDLWSKTTPEIWNTWMESFNKREVKLYLPKFTFRYEKKLNDVLKAMGMGIAFRPGIADFTGINKQFPLNIDYVKHKTFVEVNEEGTEAAAVTIVAIELTSIGPGGTPIFRADHPFIFAIREKSTNSIVFLGKVAEPVIEE
jgi:serine protease inhibitor